MNFNEAAVLDGGNKSCSALAVDVDLAREIITHAHLIIRAEWICEKRKKESVVWGLGPIERLVHD